ncbi:hypothetical protein A2U01_0119311, partial [Trifolium medium]|nr:hypothetical protein [Trifolium medium]
FKFYIAFDSVTDWGVNLHP